MNRLPTTDLYFRDACAHRIARWWRSGPIRPLGANSFQCGDAFILIRRDTDALMHRALCWPGRLIYLIDDDIDGAASSPGLPDGYRRRLAAFARNFHQPLVDRADTLIVSSAVLQDLFAAHSRVIELDPFWSLPLADTAHHRDPATIDLVHLGTGSHAAGLAALAPALLRLLDSDRRLRFTFIAQPGIHSTLDAHPGARRVPPRAWPRYRRWLGRQRFHIGLYPLTDTPFDRARSANKLIEHGIVGAVGIYPEDWPVAGRMPQGAILAPAAPDAWFDTLAAAVDDRKTLEGKAFAARQDLLKINNPLMQRRTWSVLLGIAI